MVDAFMPTKPVEPTCQDANILVRDSSTDLRQSSTDDMLARKYLGISSTSSSCTSSMLDFQLELYDLAYSSTSGNAYVQRSSSFTQTRLGFRFGVGFVFPKISLDTRACDHNLFSKSSEVAARSLGDLKRRHSLTSINEKPLPVRVTRKREKKEPTTTWEKVSNTRLLPHVSVAFLC